MDVRQETLRLKSEAAALRFMNALRALERKYREDQAREPATGRGGFGGRFASEGRGAGRGGAHAFAPPVATGAARSAPALAAAGGAEAAAAMAPGVGAAMLGAMGVSRAAGMAAVGSGTAGGMTPILGLPMPHLVPRAFKNAGDGGTTPIPQGRFDEECDEQFEKDLVSCQTQAAMYGRGKKSRSTIFATCERTALQRLGECRRGGVGDIKTPLYLGNHHYSPRRR